MNKTRPKQLSFRVSEEEYRQLQEKILESADGNFCLNIMAEESV